MATILCVDDEPAIGVVLEHTLTRLGHRPLLADSVERAMQTVGRACIDLIIADYRMPDATGLDLLERLKFEGHDLPVIMMTAYSTIEHAVRSIKCGAADYLTKPIQAESLQIAINQALEMRKLLRENEAFRQQIAGLESSREIIGDSSPMRQVMRTIGQVAPTRATVLLEGESGTGKELYAQAVHDQSPRRDQPFVTLNCAAMPEGLVESALFGHEKGAFTGATMGMPGAFERAHRGTLLLDEISEMRVDLQAKLLRVIQEQKFDRVGGKQSISVDVRLIVTTNQDLKSEVQSGRFRSDLYYRVNVVPIRTPPLREHLEDIALLVHHFTHRAAQELDLKVPTVPPETIELLRSYHWPGNVRELQNAVERAVILAQKGTLEPEAFSSYFDTSLTVPQAPPARQVAGDQASPVAVAPEYVLNIRELERIAIDRALQKTSGNRTRAAKLLGISERTLRNKLNAPKAMRGGSE